MESGKDEMKAGQIYNLGTITLSEEEIISFAKQFDPLDFHVDRVAAFKSPFKGIIASGPLVFTQIHKTRWIPLFGHTVIAGLEVNRWKFLKPVYPGKTLNAVAKIIDLKRNEEKQYSVITWGYEFSDDKDELVQSLEMTILHKL